MKLAATLRWCRHTGCFLFSIIMVVQSVNAADAPAQDLPSAADFIKAATPPAGLIQGSSSNQLVDRAHKLAAQRASLDPKDAARQWLSLVIALPDLREGNDYEGAQKAGEAIEDALPPPAAWKELAPALASLPATSDPQRKAWRTNLQIIFAVLNNDRAALTQLAADLEKKPGGASANPSGPLLSESFASVTYNSGPSFGPNDLGASLRFYLLASSDNVEDARAEARKILGNFNTNNRAEVEIVQHFNLVSLLGSDEADKLLTPLIISGKWLGSANAATQELETAIALRDVAKLNKPAWILASHPTGAALFDALVQRYGIPPGSAKSFTSGYSDLEDGLNGFFAAAQIKLATLVRDGKVDDAFALFDQLRAKIPDFDPQWNRSARDGLHDPADSGRIADHLLALAKAAPDSVWWEEGLPFAVEANHADSWLTEMDHARQQATGDTAAALNKLYQTSLFDFGHEEEGLALWRQNVAGQAAKSTDSSNEINGNAFEDATNFYQAAKLLGKTDLAKEALGYLAAFAGKDSARLEALAGLYLDAGRNTDAANTLTTALRNQLTEEMRNQNSSEYVYPSFYNTNLPAMAEVYAKAGRWNDVLDLIQQAPWWGADDVREKLTETTYRTPFGVIAAEALYRTGHPDDARHVLYAYLDRVLGNDRAYELLLTIDGDGAFTKLDALAKISPFEERPLLWQGVILLRQGKAADAEKVLRQAIAIDPSDGEEPHGDRMRAYDVLAQALDAQGRTDDAKIYHNAIQAIRLAESADDFYHAGLTGHALQMYRDALGTFTDAYCIQSRLAKYLYEEGKYDEAAEHYQRAFELMPSSFGRVESHCFGCEGVFDGPLAKSVAEKVFNAYAAKNPAVPQAHYLLGKYYENFNQPEEAVASFQQAVKLDPLYLNAWRQLAQNLHELPGHGSLANEAALAINRLSPTGLLFSGDVAGVTDLAEFWKIASDKTAGNDARATTPVLPFTASARLRAAHPPMNNYFPDEEHNTPERLIFQHPLIQEIWGRYN